MCDDIISKCKFSKWKKTRFLNERNPLDSLREKCMPGVRELLPARSAAARLLSKTHILPAAARTIRYSRTFQGSSCILSSFLSYCTILENFLRNQIRCLVTDFCVTWTYWDHQRVSIEVRNVRTIQGVTGERMRQQQFCLTIWIWGVEKQARQQFHLQATTTTTAKTNQFFSDNIKNNNYTKKRQQQQSTGGKQYGLDE